MGQGLKAFTYIVCGLILALFVLAEAKSEEVFSPSVYDGDTIVTDVKPFQNLAPIKIRIRGIDTPELRTDCLVEKDKAKAARQLLRNMVSGKSVTYTVSQWDKYGGRVVADVFVDGKNVADVLIANGLAVRYNGEKKTHNWGCGK